MLKHQRGAMRAVMDMSLFVLLLLSGHLCSASGFQRDYYYVNTEMFWSEAQSYCKENYNDLATVDSMDDVNKMMNTVNDGYSGSVWIGLKRPTTLTWYDYSCAANLDFVCYDETTGYILITDRKNWRDAQSHCRQYHTDLASIHSLEEQNQIRIVSEETRWVWIGLSTESWQWSDQWSPSFTNWAAGQPSASGDCVAMSTTDSGKWIQNSCDLQYPFVCYEGDSASGLWRPYHYIHQSMSWSEAQSYCRARFTDLATVDSMNDVNRMMNTVNDGYSGSVWIGLKRGTHKRWGWSMGDDTYTMYSPWETGYPKEERSGYVIRTILKNWTDAQSYCRQYHTDLATISSPEEQNQIFKAVGADSGKWIQYSCDQQHPFICNGAARLRTTTNDTGTDSRVSNVSQTGKPSHAVISSTLRLRLQRAGKEPSWMSQTTSWSTRKKQEPPDRISDSYPRGKRANRLTWLK
ncbi:C-type mannose receptor 2-like [Triplophysa dalaica]|uniref:C-type mannose receptor 2-like n=1 Tax=Triplophysa dalaica TaxID=1582913 RepID=UPI0024DFF169|nr:C-type mannose receptor 2-like [Triplophysa dalaica]